MYKKTTSLLTFFLIPLFFYTQNTTVIVLDKSNKKPLIDVQILSNEGSLLFNTNLKGQFNISNLRKLDIKNIVIYEPNYKFLEYNINELPEIIYLEESKTILLDNVIIQSKKRSNKYFLVKAFIRSWQLVNDKLARYGDGLIQYLIPYKNSNNDIVTGIKNYVTEYRTFKIDSIKQKSRIISISAHDSFFDYNIPKRDVLSRRSYENYKVEKFNDSVYNIFNNGKNVGYVIYNEKKTPSKINLSESFDGDEAIKNTLWKFSGSYKNIEEWTGNEKERHLSYLFNNEKKIIETKVDNRRIETITEIFFDNDIIYNDKKPKNSKRHIDKDRSFYNSEYWKNSFLKHPLPSTIKKQLININENKNIY